MLAYINVHLTRYPSNSTYVQCLVNSLISVNHQEVFLSFPGFLKHVDLLKKCFSASRSRASVNCAVAGSLDETNWAQEQCPYGLRSDLSWCPQTPYFLRRVCSTYLFLGLMLFSYKLFPASICFCFSKSVFSSGRKLLVICCCHCCSCLWYQ